MTKRKFFIRTIIMSLLLLILSSAIPSFLYSGLFSVNSLGIAHAATAGLYSFNITLNPGANYERILFASHGGTLADGNWIELTQGIPMPEYSTA